MVKGMELLQLIRNELIGLDAMLGFCSILPHAMSGGCVQSTHAIPINANKCIQVAVLAMSKKK